MLEWFKSGHYKCNFMIAGKGILYHCQNTFFKYYFLFLFNDITERKWGVIIRKLITRIKINVFLAL